jgi:hypothetical protein
MRLLFLFATAALLLSAADPAKPDLVKEGDRWWAHIQVLADDNMEGRNTGSPGHLRAARFLAGEFEHAGLKPAGVSGYLQPVKFKVAQIDEEHSSLAIVGDGKVTPLKLGEDANLAVRAGLAEKIDAELVFCGYGLSIPEYKFNDLAGLDLKGKIAVYIGGGPSNVPGNLRSHYSTRAERWKALHAAGAIGIVAIANPKNMDIPWARSTLSRLNPTMELEGEKFSDTPGEEFGAVFNPAHAEQLFADSGHTFAEMLALADQGQPLPHFPLRVRLRAT